MTDRHPDPAAADSGDPWSPAPTGVDAGRGTPTPGLSVLNASRPLRKRERAWIILLLLLLGYVLIELIDRSSGIPNR